MNPLFLPLHTERLILRELTPDDTPALAQMLGDAEVMRYSVAGVLSEKATGEFIDWCRMSYRERGFGPWAVVEQSTSTLAGFCGLNAERGREAAQCRTHRVHTGLFPAKAGPTRYPLLGRKSLTDGYLAPQLLASSRQSKR